jgi:hypothetical protein
MSSGFDRASFPWLSSSHCRFAAHCRRLWTWRLLQLLRRLQHRVSLAAPLRHLQLLGCLLTIWLSSWLHWASMMWQQQLLLLQHG